MTVTSPAVYAKSGLPRFARAAKLHRSDRENRPSARSAPCCANPLPARLLDCPTTSAAHHRGSGAAALMLLHTAPVMEPFEYCLKISSLKPASDSTTGKSRRCFGWSPSPALVALVEEHTVIERICATLGLWEQVRSSNTGSMTIPRLRHRAALSFS